MKKITALFMFFCLIAAVLACSKDDDPQPTPDITTYTNIRMGNQNSQTGCFINLSTGKVYDFEEAFAHQNEIDVAFLHDFGYAVFVSPAWMYSAYSGSKTYTNNTYGVKFWTEKNDTRFDICEVSTPADFNAVQNSPQLQTLLAQCGMTDTNAAHDMQKDDVIQFKTNKNKRGVIKINKVHGDEELDGYVEFDIKIQK